MELQEFKDAISSAKFARTLGTRNAGFERICTPENILGLVDEIESLRAQLKAAQEQEPVGYADLSRVNDRDAPRLTSEHFTESQSPVYSAPVPAQQSQANKLADTIKEQQEIAWIQICRLLDELSPDWMARGKTGIDCALEAIRDLSKQQSPAVPNSSMVSLLRKVWKHGFDAENYDDIDFCNEITIAQSDDGKQSPAVAVPDGLEKSDLDWLINFFGEQIRSNELDSKTYYGGDTTPEAKKRNAERQERNKQNVIMFNRMLSAFSGVKSPRITVQPAVAVPDDLIKWLQNFEKMTYNSGFLWMAKDAKRFLEILQSQKITRESVLNGNPQSPSPRITEQDAREIAESVIDFLIQAPGEKIDADKLPDEWVVSDEGRALLDKLNNTDSVGG